MRTLLSLSAYFIARTEVKYHSLIEYMVIKQCVICNSYDGNSYHKCWSC